VVPMPVPSLLTSKVARKKATTSKAIINDVDRSNLRKDCIKSPGRLRCRYREV
jgi:hypothetical protein